MTNLDWLIYQNQNATRNDPLDPALIKAMGFLPEMGIQMHVVSGGQEAAGQGGSRTGSTRHDHGMAADVDFYREGRKLDWNNPADLPVLVDIVQKAKGAGVTGIGAGDDYMGAGRFHVGFGNPGVWGAGGKGVNAPKWLVEAYNGAPAASVSGPAGMPVKAWPSATVSGPAGMPVPANSVMPMPAAEEKPKSMWDKLAEIGASMAAPQQQAPAPQIMPMQRTPYVAPKRDTIDPYLKFFASLR